MKLVSMFFACVICVIIALPAFSADEEFKQVITFPNEQEAVSLQDRLSWAKTMSVEYDDGYWIGYCIERLSNPNSCIGTMNPGFIGSPLEIVVAESTAGQQSQSRKRRVDTSQRTERRDTAILFYLPAGTSSVTDSTVVEVTDMDRYIDLNGKPLVWMGKIPQVESFEFLRDAYLETQSRYMKDDLLQTIGLHQDTPSVAPFLKRVVTGNDADRFREEAVFWLAMHDGDDIPEFLYSIITTDRSGDVREEAVFALSLIKTDESSEMLQLLALTSQDKDVRKEVVFWLAERDDPDALSSIRDIIATDPSTDVRKEAVFGLSRMDAEGALDMLIDIARHSDNDEVQKQAIFWLGQKASTQATDALTDIANDDNTVELQKQAVFALSQLHHDEGISELIKIAENHPSGEVRKQAIFWLGQNGDQRAVDAIVGILRAD